MSDKEAETSARRAARRRGPAVTIPGVRLGGQLGFGGMATVFEGWDDGFNPPRHVAIKLMNTELSADTGFRVRFEREASLVADFRHDNIVHVYASGEAGGIKYIVMEYLGGGTLADKLAKNGALPPAEALHHAAVLCDALAYSHARGIVHRDVKPANVLFTADGKPILSDFGVAKAPSAHSAALTQQASVVGAPRYMAPEQELGDRVSDRADVYSLGLMLYEMLTGEPPSAAVRLQRIVDERNHFAELLPSLPDTVTELLHRCLQLDPAARPPATEFAQQLHAVAAELVVSAAGSDSGGGMRGRRLIGTAAGLALLGALAVLWVRSQDSAIEPAANSASTTVPLAIRSTPTTTQLYVDGKLMRQSHIQLERGLHRLIAVAPGHYGRIQTVLLPEQSAAPLQIELQATALPTAAQFERFLDLADARSISTAERDSVGEQTLQTALSTKLLGQDANQDAATVLEQDLQALAEVGDARAAVIMLLAPAIQAGRIAPATIDSRLTAAADGGDAMASFFAALTLRSRIQEASSRGEQAPIEMQAYCARMKQAVAQGWHEVAADYLRRDGCE